MRTTQSGHSNPNRNLSCTPALLGFFAPAGSLVWRVHVEARAEGASRPRARPAPLSPAPPG
eukprot:scaffold6453_cov61-Phaeocystis_antarctica.AAC.2